MSAVAEDTRRELRILDHTGDTKIIWDRTKEAEKEHARDTFDRFKAKGYAAYKVNNKGDKGEVLKTFDPDAEKMILAPPTVGG